MNFLEIISIILIFDLITLGIETIVKLNKSEGKLIDEVKKPLIIRINIIITLIIIQSIIAIVNIITKV